MGTVDIHTYVCMYVCMQNMCTYECGQGRVYGETMHSYIHTFCIHTYLHTYERTYTVIMYATHGGTYVHSACDLQMYGYCWLLYVRM